MIYHVGKKISWCFLCFRPTLKIKDHIVYPVLWLNEVGIVEKNLTKPTENHSFNSLYSETNMEWLYCYDPFYVTCVTFTLFKMHVYITNLVCYTYFHWFFNPECHHIFGKQTEYIFQSSKMIKTWTTKHCTSLNQWYNTE
jgi:hypothetical protein